MTAGELRVYPNAHVLAREAAAYIAALAAASIAAKDRFTIALSGGSTPRLTYGLLAMQAAGQVDWSKVHCFWGDERCVPPDHEESNYYMVKEALLSQVPIPPGNVHRMQGELPPREAAQAYKQELQACFGDRAAPRFDLILLGLGEDGHTASLFPGMSGVWDVQDWVVAYYVDILDAWRITLTPTVINAAADVTFLVTGARKAERLQQVREGPYQPDRLPAQIVAPQEGHLLWMVDTPAAML